MVPSPGCVGEGTSSTQAGNPPQQIEPPPAVSTTACAARLGGEPVAKVGPRFGYRLHKPGVAGSSPAAASTSTSEAISDYHADKAWFSKSQLWDLVSRGPQAFYARHIAGTDNCSLATPSLARGSHVHEWAEAGPDAWWARVVEIPEDCLASNGRRTKKAEEWERTLAPNSICLKADEIASYRQQFDSMLANPAFIDLTQATTQREVSIRWRDVSGLPLKCRPDALTDKVIWDIKTTKEQKPLETFWKSVIDYGYALQAVHYIAGCHAAGLDVEEFIFLVTSTVPPYACHAVRLPGRLIDKARRQHRKVIAEVQMRMELDHWLPADSGQVTELYVPERFMEESNGRRSRLPRVL